MRTITLGSGASGTGKSFLAAHLGVALSRRGMRVALVDLNLGTGDLHLTLGIIHPRFDLLDLLRGGVPSLSSTMTPAPGHERLWLVPGAEETIRPSALTPDELDRLTREIAALPVEVAIVDLAAGMSQPLLDLFLGGDLPLVVATSDASSLHEAGRFLKLARLRQGTRGGSLARARRDQPKVYTNLDDLVRDMNLLQASAGASPRAAGFRPSLVLNRSAAPEGDQSKRWKLDHGLDLPLIAAIPDYGDPADITGFVDPTMEALDAAAAAAIDLLAETLCADLELTGESLADSAVGPVGSAAP